MWNNTLHTRLVLLEDAGRPVSGGLALSRIRVSEVRSVEPSYGAHSLSTTP